MLVFYTTLLCQCVFSFGLYEDSGCISASFLYNWMISVVEILKILTSCEPCLTFCVLLLIWCTVVRSPRLHAVHRCVVLLQMLHVAWSVCCAPTRGWAVQKWLSQLFVAGSCGSKEPCIIWVSRSDESIRHRKGWQDTDLPNYFGLLLLLVLLLLFLFSQCDHNHDDIGSNGKRWCDLAMQPKIAAMRLWTYQHYRYILLLLLYYLMHSLFAFNSTCCMAWKCNICWCETYMF